MKRTVIIVIILMILASPVLALDEIIKATISNDIIYVNGSKLVSDTPILKYDGRNYIPLRAVSEVLKKNVDYVAGVVKITDIVPTPAPTPTPKPVSTPLKIGDKVSYADWEFKVVKVETYSTIGEHTAKGIYIVVLVEFTNKAKMERYVGSDFIVKDNSDRIFAMDSSASLGYYHSFDIEAWHLDKIGPSFTVTVPLAFDVAKDSMNLLLMPKDYPNNPIFLIDKVN